MATLDDLRRTTVGLPGTEERATSFVEDVNGIRIEFMRNPPRGSSAD